MGIMIGGANPAPEMKKEYLEALERIEKLKRERDAAIKELGKTARRLGYSQAALEVFYQEFKCYVDDEVVPLDHNIYGTITRRHIVRVAFVLGRIHKTAPGEKE